MKLSARNVLKGIVVQVTPGAVNTEVLIRITEGVEILAMISSCSVDRLGLKPGSPAYAVVKSSNVIVAVD